MGAHTNIAWTDCSWTVVTGCEAVGDGCRNCYAERMLNTRMIANPTNPRYRKPFDVVICHENRLGWPLGWRAPSRIFVSSQGDLFHRHVPDEFIAHCWWIMGQCAGYLDPSRYRGHTFQVLTKRPERMKRWFRSWHDDIVRARWLRSFHEIDDWMGGPKYWPRPVGNIWLGTSIESNKYAGRADELRGTPAALRFLSLEPLLGPVDEVDLTDIGWVIVGGESGPGYRPMDTAWLREVVVRCAQLDIPLFVKQDSSLRPGQQGRITDDVWSLKQFPKRLRYASGEVA